MASEMSANNHLPEKSDPRDTYYYNASVIPVVPHFLTLALLNKDIPCLCKQCRSEEANWSGSTLFVIKYVNLYQQPGSSNLIGWKLEVGVAS